MPPSIGSRAASHFLSRKAIQAAALAQDAAPVAACTPAEGGPAGSPPRPLSRERLPIGGVETFVPGVRLQSDAVPVASLGAALAAGKQESRIVPTGLALPLRLVRPDPSAARAWRSERSCAGRREVGRGGTTAGSGRAHPSPSGCRLLLHRSRQTALPVERGHLPRRASRKRDRCRRDRCWNWRDAISSGLKLSVRPRGQSADRWASGQGCQPRPFAW